MVEKVVPYNSLKIENNLEKKEIIFNNIKILVNQYITSKDGYDLLMSTLEKSKEDGYYNPFIMDIIFHLNIVYVFTNITFTEEERQDELALYDKLQNSGLIDLILENIPENIYRELLNNLDLIAAKNEAYSISAAGFVTAILEELPKRTKEVKEIIEQFDPEKFSNLFAFAKKMGYKNTIEMNTIPED